MKFFVKYSLLLSFLVFSCGDTETEPVSKQTQEPGGKGDFFGFGDDIPFADLYNSTSGIDRIYVRGRIVEEDPDDIGDLETTPLNQVSQDEMRHQKFTVVLHLGKTIEVLGESETNKEGYLDTSFDVAKLKLEAGRYLIEVKVDDKFAGNALVTLIKPHRSQPIVRSDVDLTYLKTDFHSTSAMLKLFREKAEDKTALFAMPTIYRAIRGKDKTPITFLSGSPRFFKRTLESKMILDTMAQDGLVLKPFKDIVGRNLLKLSWTKIVPSLKEQVGYKLFWLLKLRQQIPPSTPEILMGDDTEADFVVYNIYYRFMIGELELDTLEMALKKIDVAESWLTPILEMAKTTIRTLEGIPVVIYINHTEVTGEAFDITNWKIPGVTRYHRGAWPLALDMAEEGWIDEPTVEKVHRVLLDAGLTELMLESHKNEVDFLNK